MGDHHFRVDSSFIAESGLNDSSEYELLMFHSRLLGLTTKLVNPKFKLKLVCCVLFNSLYRYR